ncbi:S9 family peptidase [Novosphingobium sp. RD2P27]|uniref:S9 family peptidase n=1 Tax=Novosphingobium kalidii TaxID=3230299 RepID=A0ABV2D306_9SPHN
MSLAVAMVAVATSSAHAENVDAVAAAFGAREDISHISMAPSGVKVAMVMPLHGTGDAVGIADLVKGGDVRQVLAVTGPGQRISRCSWASDEQLLCIVTVRQKKAGEVLGYSRVVGVTLDGKPARILTHDGNMYSQGFTWFGGSVIDFAGSKPGEVLMLRQFVPDTFTGSHIGSSDKGLGVESIDPKTGKRSIVERGVGNAVEYISDGHGNVRIMGINPDMNTGYAKNFIDYSYRKAGEREWASLGRVTYNSSGTVSGFQPVAVDPALDVAYGFKNVDGFSALYRVKLDGSGKEERVLARAGTDVDGLVQIGRSRRVVGASYSTEYRTVDFFDPELAKLRTALSKALPGDPAVSFLDASADEGRLLMFIGSDIDPGRYYSLNKATRKLAEVLPVRSALLDRELAEMKPVQISATDGTKIPGYLTLPPGSSGKGLPAIVMPHGGPSSRDDWGFDWLAQFFAARGFAVLQPNFRGSAGYGNAWFGKNGFQSWRTAIGDVNDAGRWLVSSGIAAGDKLAIVGWSYGGYAALQSGVLEPGLFKAIIAIAPVTDLALLRSERRNYSDYVIVDKMIGNGPHVSQGSPAQNAPMIQAPVLMFHGDWDTNVDIEQSRRMESRLRAAGKEVELVTFAGLQHSLVESSARAQMLKKSDDFLRRNLGLPAS